MMKIRSVLLYPNGVNEDSDKEENTDYLPVVKLYHSHQTRPNTAGESHSSSNHRAHEAVNMSKEVRDVSP